ncbi:ribonuclease H-like domain-containing protein [Lentinula guzmanii]|uniref:RNA exonuclease 4 n=1 Tax=Lentinula guzmanii TaxID=2804957 RepID=A0AA38J679_9AGAR|nr:ribonuclease H-like domain-containing protein [Lentinula guzmanii]
MSNSVFKSNTASSNWLALQKNLNRQSTRKNESIHKRRKINHYAEKSSPSSSSPSITAKALGDDSNDHKKNGESLLSLKRIVFGETEYSTEQKQPGKFIAIDCEMVGVGIDGSESSLARVTLVNYHGAVQMDEFVRQRERVVDYRTQYSGIRESDMQKAKPFDQIQKRVADLIQDRILVGHAVHNDLKACRNPIPTHSRRRSSVLARDTQYLAGKSKVVRSKYVALRKLVEQELGIVIQAGEHSSLVDARATMAVYRLHRKEWDHGLNILKTSTSAKMSEAHDGDSNTVETQENEEFQNVKRKGKRKRTVDEEGVDVLNAEETQSPLRSHPKSEPLSGKQRGQPGVYPGGGRKGVSSGLSTIVRRGGSERGGQKTQWWKELGSSGSSGSKGSLRL